MKRPLVMIGAAVAALGLLAGCSTTNSGSSSSGSTTLDFAALQGGYGTAMYHKVIDAYEKIHPNVHIKLTLSKDIEDEITPQMKAGNYPDLVELGEDARPASPRRWSRTRRSRTSPRCSRRRSRVRAARSHHS